MTGGLSNAARHNDLEGSVRVICGIRPAYGCTRSALRGLVRGSGASEDTDRRQRQTGQNQRMEATEAPPGHTAEGGVLVGSVGARRRLVLFEDPQCPYCREFEDASGDVLRHEIAAGAVAVEYRMRSFLGVESVRADNALAAAAEAGSFDELRREVFANQPPEHSGGFTIEDLLGLGRRAGLSSAEYVTTVREGRYESWVRQNEKVFAQQDPEGTPYAVLDGRPVRPETLYDPHALGALIRG